MNLDLNNASYQSSTIHLIPPQSKVFVQLSIVFPSEENKGSSPELTRRNSGLEQLCVKLQVLKGFYEHTYFFHSFNICGAKTKGHQKAIEISKSQLRALVESNWAISPTDTSESAMQARKLTTLNDINGYAFPILVDSEVNDKGFLTNKLKAIITADDPDYQLLLMKGEVIKD